MSRPKQNTIRIVDNRKKPTRTIGGYQYVGNTCIGKGSFGEVFRARKDGKEYAIKEVKTERLEAKDREHCVREVEAMRSCTHPNLVKLYEHIYDANDTNKHYIVMDYYSKGSLKDYLKRQVRTLEIDHILNIMIQLAGALKYLHEDMRMIHRDVKPANIFMANDDTIKLGDLALVRKVDTNFKGTVLAGTPLYMSPELIECQEYDFKTDIWSLGCTLYELFFRQALFQVAISFETLKDMIKMSKSRLTDISKNADVNHLYKEMMRYDASRRPSIGSVLTRLQKCSQRPRVARDRHDNDCSSSSSESPSPEFTSPRDSGSHKNQNNIGSISFVGDDHDRSDSQQAEPSYSQASTYKPSRSSRTSSNRSTGARSTNISPSALSTGSRRSPDSVTQSSVYSRHLSGSVSRRSDLAETSDYGTDTETRPEGVKMVRVKAVVMMTEEEYSSYENLTRAEKGIENSVGTETLKKITSLLEKTAADGEDCGTFLKRVEDMDTSACKKCKSHLFALWGYKTELLDKRFKLAS